MTREALLKRLRLPGDIIRYCTRASVLSGFHPLTAAWLMTQCLARGYWPSEAFTLGLLNPAKDRVPADRYLSKRDMVRMQHRLNPPSWELMLSDKGIFYRFCQSAGLPIPRLAAIYAGDATGWTETRPVPQGKKEWAEYFVKRCPPCVVIKPTLGRHGHSIVVLTREGSDFVEAGGRKMSVSQLLDMLGTDRHYNEFVVQDRMHNHFGLKPIVPGQGLATSRMLTFIPPSGKPEILTTDLKLVMGTNLTSNLSLGATGNMVARVTPETGVIEYAVSVAPGRGFVKMERHPETGAVYAGFQIPDWQAMRALALQAAEAFRPIRAVGWDVACTTEGPMLIEGNFFFDPPNAIQKGKYVYDCFARGLA
jgi:hypothetical protein